MLEIDFQIFGIMHLDITLYHQTPIYNQISRVFTPKYTAGVFAMQYHQSYSIRPRIVCIIKNIINDIH